MHKITKEFDFCYGHRVWSQELNAALSIDNKCVCRHLHGHQGKIIIELSAPNLTRGMVTDFKHLNWFKNFVDDFIDHKFIIDLHDPAFTYLIPVSVPDELGKSYLSFEHFEEYHFTTINMKYYEKAESWKQELLEGFIIVDFVPTSENISKWIYDIVSKKMNPYGIQVSCVEFKETPKTAASYTEPGMRN